jgi:hypothetical protein
MLHIDKSLMWTAMRWVKVCGWKRPLDGAWAGYEDPIRDMVEWLMKRKILIG